MTKSSDSGSPELVDRLRLIPSLARTMFSPFSPVDPNYPPLPPAYAAALQSAREWFLSEVDATASQTGTSGWITVPQHKDPTVQTDTKIDLTRGVGWVPLARGIGEVEGWTAEEVMAVVVSPVMRSRWDITYAGADPIERFGKESHLFRSTTRGFPPFISPREFLAVYAITKEENGDLLLIQTSVESVDVPVQKGFVRANLELGGWRIRTLAPRHLLVTHINKADLAGSIPQFIITTLGAKLLSKIGLNVSKIHLKALRVVGFPPLFSCEAGGEESFVFGEEKIDYTTTRWKEQGTKEWRESVRVRQPGRVRIEWDGERFLRGMDVRVSVEGLGSEDVMVVGDVEGTGAVVSFGKTSLGKQFVLVMKPTKKIVNQT